MVKRIGAGLLCLCLTLMSAGPEAWAAGSKAVAPAVAPAPTVVTAIPSPSLAPVPGLPLLPVLSVLPAAPSLQTVGAAFARPESARPAASASPAAAGLRPLLERLAAPSGLESLPAGAPASSAREAGEADFALRLGLEDQARPAASAESAALPALSASRPGLAKAAPKPAAPRRDYRSAVFPAAAAAGLGALFAGVELVRWAVPALARPLLHAAAGAEPSLPARLFDSASAGAAAVLAVAAAAFAALAVLDAALLSYAKRKGKGVTDADFRAFLKAEVGSGRLDAGAARLVKIHRPDGGRRDWSFGYAAGGFVYVRPELAAVPWLARMVLLHELSHLKRHGARGPPQRRGLAGLAAQALSELSARARELRGAKGLKEIKIPVLDRVLREAQLSLRLQKPFEVLVLNADTPELSDPGVYKALSGGKAKVLARASAAPEDVLAEAGNRGRLRAVVLDKAWSVFPQAGTQQAARLDLTVRQLDEIFLLATRRLQPLEPGFTPDSAEGRRFRDLAQALGRQSARPAEGGEALDRQVKEFWRQVSAERLKGLGPMKLVEGLYASLQDRGLAFLSFGPTDPGVAVMEKLLRYWEGQDGGQFRASRVDLESGGNILILRKVESRVGLWLKPARGAPIKESIPDAAASEVERARARKALESSGFAEHLKDFDELGVEVRSVFGADVGRQEIFVSVPRKNAGAVKKFVSAASIQVQHSQEGIEPLLTDTAALHRLPPVWRLGFEGQGGRMMWIGTGADAGHEDFASGIEVADMVGEGPEDWIGHETHVTGISVSRSPVFQGMARFASGIVAKVFSTGSPGAADGPIMAAGVLAVNRGIDVVNVSLGIRGSSGDNLARFFSDLTLQKRPDGDSVIVVASAGNSGPFDRSQSQPAAGENVLSAASAAKSQDDGRPEISFFSSPGPDVDKRFGVKRLRLSPKITAIGGDIVTDPGDPNVYKRGVFSAKSKDMPLGPADTPDRRHTGLAGTSMASPAVAGIALIMKLAIKATNAAAGFVGENLPLAVRGVLMRTADDMGVPVWHQGAGFINAWDAAKLVLGSAAGTWRWRVSRVPGLGWLAQGKGEPWGWVERWKAVMDVEDAAYRKAELARGEAQARFESEVSDETPPEARHEATLAVNQETAKGFTDEAKRLAPQLVRALVDVPAADGAPASSKDPVWLVRHQAALALLNFHLPETALALAEAALHDEDARVRQMALLAIAEIPTHATDVLLEKSAADPRYDVALYSAYALARHGDRSAVGRIREGLSAADKTERFTAAWLLGQLGGKASAAEAEALSAKVVAATERGNIRHLAAASLTNLAESAPEALSDRVVEELLSAAGPDNLALTRTISRFFPAALQNRALADRVRAEPLRASVSAFVLKNRDAVGKPGALGELVTLLARIIDLPLDSPTSLPDPSGLGVAGVDPAMGALDLLVVPARAGASLPSDLAARFGASVAGRLSLVGATWIRVPEHKLFALTSELKDFKIRVAAPLYPATSRPLDPSLPGAGLALDRLKEGAPLPLPEGTAVARLTAARGVSEAKVLWALDRLAEAGDPRAAVLAFDLVGPRESMATSPLRLALGRLALRGWAMTAAAGNEGPIQGTISTPAPLGLVSVVAAAGAETGLQFYSSRATPSGPALAWTELVPEIEPGFTRASAGTAAAEAPRGTGVAAARSAEKLAALRARMSLAFAERGGLPPGHSLYIAAAARRALEPVPGREAHEVGGGLFGAPDAALKLLEERLKDPDEVAREAGLLLSEAAARYAWARPREEAAPAAAAASAAREGLVSGAIPRAAEAGARAAASLAEEPARPALKELKQVLGDGPRAGDVFFSSFSFRKPSGAWTKARAAGLEGFLYSKLELERAYGQDALLGQLWDFFAYLDNLLLPFPWAQPWRERAAALSRAQVSLGEKNAALNALLREMAGGLRRDLAEVDGSLWLRESSTYMILARAYNRAKPGQAFFDSLDEEELARIRRATRADTLWLLDIFEIGEVRRWGTGGGSPYSIKGYRVKEALGGDEAFRRFAARARAAGFRVAVDQIPNHVSLDSDLVRDRPEALLHVVPPQDLTDEEIMAAVPRHGKDPVFYLARTPNYPEADGRRVEKRILVHHPLTDYGGDMWIDMAQRDFSRREARDWEAAQTARLVGELGADLLRRDMSYEVTNARFFPRWSSILAGERDRSAGWMRDAMTGLLADFEARRQALGGAEFLEQAWDAARAAKPGAALIDEAYGHSEDLSRAGSTGVYNKNDHDLSLGQSGLYDALVSREGARIRAALRNAAFRLWQKGGAAMVNFIGTHDAGEGNPVDKFGRHFKAAAVTALLLRPTLLYNGFEQGVGQDRNIKGDLSRSVDRQKAIPFDVPVSIDWSQSDPGTQAFLDALLGAAERHKSLFSSGAVEALDPQDPKSTIAAWSAARPGAKTALIGAANFGEEKGGAQLRLDAPVLAGLGAFVPDAAKEYVLRDVLHLDEEGRPAEYRRAGAELLEKGLYVELPAGGAQLFEVSEVGAEAEAATAEAAPVQLELDLAAPEPPAAPVEPAAKAEPPAPPSPTGWRALSWADKLVFLALVPFFFLQLPQIAANFHHLATDPAKISILPWIGYSTGILANSNLWGFHIDGKRHAVAFVQGAGVITSSVVLAQIFAAGFMPLPAALAMAGLILASVAVNALKWLGRLGERPWKAWNRVSTLLGLFALPLGFSVTFNLMKTQGSAVLAASAAFAALGGAAMLLDRRGKLPARLHALWGSLGAWLGTLLFVFLPIPQLVNNFSHPENVGGIALGTLLLSTLGNLFEVTGALHHRSQIWFVGSFWSVAVGSWAVLLSLLLVGAVSPLLFLAFTGAVGGYLFWVLRRVTSRPKDGGPPASLRQALKFIIVGEK